MFKLLILVTFVQITFGARILGIAPIPSYSHQIVYRAIWKELALRGHELVVITTDPMNDPTLKNYKEIDISFSYDIWNIKHNVPNLASEATNVFKLMNIFTTALHDMAAQGLAHPNVQALIQNKTEHFDLVMIEFMQLTYLPFKRRFGAPMIGLSSLDIWAEGHEIMGNPTHPVIYPDFSMPFIGKLTFFQRVISTYFDVIMRAYFRLLIISKEDETVKKTFGPDYPPLLELSKEADMMFTNVNPIMHTVRPLAPATITIGGGIHINKEKPLPMDLKQFLDDAKQGVIYMSLGSNVKSKDLSIEEKTTLLKTFSELPYQILWKFEAEDLPGKPDNVKIMKWIPQQDVLRHPNIKVFITQGGLQSLDETLYSHVPIVGMPFFGDQDTNIKKIVAKGLGLSIDHKTMKADQLKSTILEVIKNPKYRNTVKYLAELTRDEPMSALEKAVWWTEYVLRHKGAQHLKGASVGVPLYQYYHLDVLAFTILVVSIVITLIYVVFKKIINMILNCVCKKKLKVKSQ